MQAQQQLLFFIFLLLACAKPPEKNMLVAEAKRALAERERRLHSFQIEVESSSGSNRVRHEFAFRSPNLSRGHLLTPPELELAFDGTTLRRRQSGAVKVEIIPLEGTPDTRAFTLASTFMPFAPEGYRTPLLPLSGVSASPATHPLAAQAVKLTVKASDGVTVDYVLRLPSGDFLAKTTHTDTQLRTLQVETEHCDARLQLCVPTLLSEKMGNEQLGTTTITSVSLNPSIPQDFFTLRPPQ